MAKTLEQVCADGFAALDRCDLAMYHLGHIPLHQIRAYKAPKQAGFAFGGDLNPKGKQPKGPSPLTVDKPVPLPKLPSGGMKVNA